MKVVSFDIFDTCLIRKCGYAEAVYSILGDKLFPEDTTKAREFETQRHFFAEERACKYYNTEYPTLYQIYSCLKLPYLEYSPKSLCELEESVEEFLLLGTYSIREKIKKYRRHGYKIIFISDMYHSSSFLRRILCKEGILVEEDMLFVSCECNASKYRGDLYEYVSQQVGKKHWIHYGDNKYSDIRMAFRHGLIPKRVVYKYNRYEKRWLEDESYVSTSAMAAGCSKALRLSLAPNMSSTLAIDIIATMYIPFVSWVLKQASNKGITKLLFFARDGLLFYQIAQRLETKLHTGISLAYFYVSRKSLYLPSLYKCTIEDFQECDEDCLQLPWSKFKNKFCLNNFPQDFDSAFFAIKNSLFQDFVEEKSLKARLTFLEYLTQNGITKSDKVGIVDLGWVGSGRKAINKIFKNEGFQKPVTFYFGVEKERVLSQYGEYESYQYMEHNSKGNILPSPLIFEHYFSITQDASTIGYKKCANCIEPIFAEGDIAEWQKALYENNSKMVAQYTDDLVFLLGKGQLPDLSRLGRQSWMLLKENPRYSEYQVFKNIELEHFGTKHLLAPSISILKFIYLKIIKHSKYIFWPEISLCGNKITGRINLWIYRKLKIFMQ